LLAVGIVTKLRTGSKKSGSIPEEKRNFSPLQIAQTGCGAHSTPYSMGPVGSSPGSKVAVAWGWI